VVALAIKSAHERGATGPLLIFDDATGRAIDVDLRGSDDEVRARLAPSPTPEAVARGRGRPRLGVVAREVTLLPRQWEWLGLQPGGASVALRRLVDEARRVHADRDRIRQAHERAYHFIAAIAGNLPGFEEATRALFANDRARFGALIAQWPADIRTHATRLGFEEADDGHAR